MHRHFPLSCVQVLFRSGPGSSALPRQVVGTFRSLENSECSAHFLCGLCVRREIANNEVEERCVGGDCRRATRLSRVRVERMLPWSDITAAAWSGRRVRRIWAKMSNWHTLTEVFGVEHFAVDDVPNEVPLCADPMRHYPAATGARHARNRYVHVTVRPAFLPLCMKHHPLERLA
jgi:hypothetical protein